MWKITFEIFIKSLRLETPGVRKNGFYESKNMFLVLSIKNVFVKIKNSVFPPKYTRYGKKISLDTCFINWKCH